MAIEVARLAEGTRVRVKQTLIPQEAGIAGRTGTVIVTSDYETKRLGVALDGEDGIRVFMPVELDVIEEVALPPERQAAKLRSALP